MFRQIASAAFASAILLSGGTALAEHEFVLNSNPPEAQAKGQKGQSAAQHQSSGNSGFVPYTTDGQTPVGSARAQEVFPAEKFSTLRDSRK